MIKKLIKETKKSFCARNQKKKKNPKLACVNVLQITRSATAPHYDFE